MEQFYETIAKIEGNKDYRPEERDIPFYKTIGHFFLILISLVIYTYAAFLVLQLMLFNIIMLMILFAYWFKVLRFFQGLIEKWNYDYKTNPLKKFIQREQEQVYSKCNFQLVQLDQGHYIELHLAEDINV